MTDFASQNPFAAPVSNLQETRSDLAPAPSIEEALTRGYDFRIGDVIEESWRLVKGAKTVLFLGFLIFYAAMLAASWIVGFALGKLGVSGDAGFGITYLLQVVISVIAAMVSYPLLAGVNMAGIRRAAGQPLSFNELFSHFGRAGAIILAALLVTLLVYVGYALLLIPGIYLSIAYMFALPLIVERGLSPWEAMEVSRKAVSQHWFKIFGLYLLLSLIMLVAALPLGIGLVWVVPLTIISTGVLYRIIFGVLPLGS